MNKVWIVTRESRDRYSGETYHDVVRVFREENDAKEFVKNLKEICYTAGFDVYYDYEPHNVH